MNYHNILHDNMLNGEGLRVVLFTSGCSHNCYNCHNPQTWNCNSGIPFDIKAREEIFEQLDKDYISGITFSGGDPMHENNLSDTLQLIMDIKAEYKDKTIWLYTGYTWEELINPIEKDWKYYVRRTILEKCDVLVDGKFEQELSDIKYMWAGSTNQRIIDVKDSLRQNKVIDKSFTM